MLTATVTRLGVKPCCVEVTDGARHGELRCDLSVFLGVFRATGGADGRRLIDAVLGGQAGTSAGGGTPRIKLFFELSRVL